jgi:hypothetical protein
MRLLLGFAFCASLFICGCSQESVKTDPSKITPPSDGKPNKSNLNKEKRVD